MKTDLEAQVIEALAKEGITTEQQPDGKYKATWQGIYGEESATGDLIAAGFMAMRRQKDAEYWRGQADQEHEIIEALRQVHPLAVVISKPKHGGYRWQWWEGFGIGPTFPGIIKQALDYAMPTLLRLDPEQSKANLREAAQEQQTEVNPNFGASDWYYHPNGKEE